MDNNRAMLIGGGAGLVGLIVGYLIGAAAGPDVDAVLDQQQELNSSVAALSEALGSVDARVGGLEEQVGGVHQRFEDIRGALAELGDSQSGRLDALVSRVEGLGSEVSGAVSGIGTSVSEALSGDLDELRAKVSAIASGGGGGEATTAAAPVDGEPVGPGQTVSFGDGAVRVFLSSTDPDGERARVAINGSQTSELALGSPVRVGTCEVTLTGFTASGAVLSGDCASAVPEGSGAGTEVAMGKAEIFGEGAVRVFLSSVDPASGTARVAINGPQTTTLQMSDPVTAGDCTVELTGVGEGTATIDVGC